MVLVGQGQTVDVTDAGLLVDFGRTISRLTLKSLDDNAGIVVYALEDPTLMDGAAINEADNRAAASRMILEAGDSRGRSELNVQKIYLRTPTGQTAKVRVELI